MITVSSAVPAESATRQLVASERPEIHPALLKATRNDWADACLRDPRELRTLRQAITWLADTDNLDVLTARLQDVIAGRQPVCELSDALHADICRFLDEDDVDRVEARYISQESE